MMVPVDAPMITAGHRQETRGGIQLHRRAHRSSTVSRKERTSRYILAHGVRRTETRGSDGWGESTAARSQGFTHCSSTSTTLVLRETSTRPRITKISWGDQRSRHRKAADEDKVGRTDDMRRISIAIAAFIVALVSTHMGTTAQSKPVAAAASNEWPTYGHDPGGQRFSPLTQITPANVDRLQVAWVYHMRPAPTPESARSRSICAGTWRRTRRFRICVERNNAHRDRRGHVPHDAVWPSCRVGLNNRAANCGTSKCRRAMRPPVASSTGRAMRRHRRKSYSVQEAVGCFR